jgi:phosphoenolpyruvate carboxykinase (GTP)
MLSYQALEGWVKEMAELCQPEEIYWCDGTEEENTKLIKKLVDSGKALELNPTKRPGSYAFFSDPSDVARVENRTFIASDLEEDAGPTNNWAEPKALKETMKKLYLGSMKGRTMYVIPFMMGPFGSPLSKIGIQLTDSEYVVINMRIMTRMGRDVLKALETHDQFVPCLHSIGYPLEKDQMDLLWPSAPIDHKYITHFPKEKLIWSYGSGYGGNALLGKKCLALRIASVIAKEEGWMAEHMLILKLTNPEGVSKYVLAAFPSACGKTNLAMMVPTLPGWKVETIGDDIAWIWMKDDGRLYAINPESGFFGVAKGTSYQSNPNAMMSIRKDTIFTNVAITDDGDVWWEGIDGPMPQHLMDWKREDWSPTKGTPAAHPNCRFTVSAKQCPVLAEEWENPEGVLISAILVGGRRPSTIPLVHEALSWSHGVFMGSMMGSEVTAAAISDQIGQVRRDPFAMLPFIGYHVGDYLRHWLDMGKKSNDALLPKIFYVNWFRKDEHGDYLWPGFGHNSRVLKWIFERCEGTVSADATPIGYLPKEESIDVRGLPMKADALAQLLKIDTAGWLNEIESIKVYYQSIGDKLPDRLKQELEKQELRLMFVKEKEESNL